METKNIKPLENFDWEEFENGGKNAANVAEETKAYESTLNNVSDNEVVDGKVISSKKKIKLAPGEMENVVIPADVLSAMTADSSIVVRVEE